MTRLPLRAWHHRRIRSARDPLTKATRAWDYLRAVAKQADPAAARRVLLRVAGDIEQAADDLGIASGKGT